MLSRLNHVWSKTFGLQLIELPDLAPDVCYLLHKVMFGNLSHILCACRTPSVDSCGSACLSLLDETKVGRHRHPRVKSAFI